MKIAIMGGTGTLGEALLEYLSTHDLEITVFSRDEFKQKKLKQKYNHVKFVICDCRDPLSYSYLGMDIVFHFAALKHIDVCEKHVEECFKTNYFGLVNSARKAIDAGVKNFIFTSTDKAVLPINAYGMSKGAAEKFLFSKNLEQDVTKFSVFRWGNVAGSRGSVVNLFAESLRRESKIYLTSDEMTRFWIRIEKAVDFMINNFHLASKIEPMFPPMKASRVIDLAEAIASYLGLSNYETVHIGIKPGEKKHEHLHTSHEYCIRSDTAPQYTKEELIDMIKDII